MDIRRSLFPILKGSFENPVLSTKLKFSNETGSTPP
jgi:hypothetical protein